MPQSAKPADKSSKSAKASLSTLPRQKKYFGTDGIRGKVGSAPITPDFMLQLGWAAGRVFNQSRDSGRQILIGKDTRISGYMFESAIEAGLINAGIDVALLGPMPTPAVAYLTRTFQAMAGIVISASHNAYGDNGIKFFSAGGTKLPDDIELAIEAQLEKPMVTAEHLGKAKRITDAAGRYIEFCKGTTPAGFNLKRMKIVVDCAHGATYHVAPSVFRELGAVVDAIAIEPNGININRDCGSTKPEALRERVVSTGADLGIAFDGDGDRVVFIDHTGAVVDGDELLYIIASHRHKVGVGCNGVVGTQMSNFGLELAMQEMKIPFLRAKVGDRYVMDELQKNNWLLGGESSGHLICRDITTTGDGIISALQVLLALATSGKDLHDYRKTMHKLPQTMINVQLAQRVDISQNTRVLAAVSDIENQLAGKGRVLLRPSGTEPVIRVMVEGEDEAHVEALAKELAEIVSAAVAT